LTVATCLAVWDIRVSGIRRSGGEEMGTAMATAMREIATKSFSIGLFDK